MYFAVPATCRKETESCWFSPASLSGGWWTWHVWGQVCWGTCPKRGIGTTETHPVFKLCVIVLQCYDDEWWHVCVPLLPGTVLIPGTSQLTAKDILHRLHTSKAKCVITDDSMAPVLDSVAPRCSFLKAKVLVSQHNRHGWMNLGELSRWKEIGMN